LCRQTGETVKIYVLDGDAAIVLDCVTPEAPWFLQFVPGTRMEIVHAAAHSKAILAFLDDDTVRELLPKPLPATTPNTITDRKVLAVELAEIRRTGLAYDREEYLVGVSCIGSPIFDVHGNVAAGAGVTSLVGHDRTDDLPRIKRLVLDCARQISSAIGYDGQRYAQWLCDP
jgi:IclR family transcriptional regulator, acetate operon repressor